MVPCSEVRTLLPVLVTLKVVRVRKACERITGVPRPPTVGGTVSGALGENPILCIRKNTTIFHGAIIMHPNTFLRKMNRRRRFFQDLHAGNAFSLRKSMDLWWNISKFSLRQCGLTDSFAKKLTKCSLLKKQLTQSVFFQRCSEDVRLAFQVFWDLKIFQDSWRQDLSGSVI